ncbi:hypothetical protein R5R51_03935 [Oenococcus oeni]|uniref:hypothetical protein n=1 Tax=Oenococcus oeni TaxID=1247 RepID=UPI00050F8C60|nr:hypothetical protein [Oenococcus oeni]KGI04529.1 hypothetical protein X297_09255 [Oenococcus oeni IOEB_L40_4]OIL96384.1 hypothetical protein ATX47_02310 [Oenococcus oeni]PDH84417.1 hypothetical protein AO462_05380 [Oenococcus oeni]
MFGKSKEIDTDFYKNQVKPYLQPKDNKIYVLALSNINDWPSKKEAVRSDYTNKINLVLSSLQDDGYEIISIAAMPTVLTNGFITDASQENVGTLITYK